MWGNKDTDYSTETNYSSNKQTSQSSEPTFIGNTTVFKGEFEGAEDIVIAGKIEGMVRFTKNTVTISESGVVEGDVFAAVIQVEGTINGDLFGGERVVVHASGDVRGNITAPRVCLEDGAKLKGTVDMDPATNDSAWKASTVSTAVSNAQQSKSTIEALTNLEDKEKKNGKSADNIL